MIVVDASIGVKWFREEAQSAEAEALLKQDAGAIVVPDIFAVEVASALVRNANVDKASQQPMRVELDRLIRLLSGGVIDQVRTTPQMLGSAAFMAIDIGHPLKDCIYLMLAIEANCPLVTCDAKFAEKARPRYSDIRLLGDII